MIIAYQGEPGAYSEQAAMAYGGEQTETLPCESFELVFNAVAEGRAQHGVLPLENSIGGTIHQNFDLLSERSLPVTGEVEILVQHCLLALPGTTRDQIRRIYSHPQGLAQCMNFLRTMPGVQIIATYDTAGSAKMIRDGNMTDAGAIASAQAGQNFQLAVLESDIQDYPDNITRFAIIGGVTSVDTEKTMKTMVVFTAPNKPGALQKILAVFSSQNINLTKLESRPEPGRPWEYRFYAEFEWPSNKWTYLDPRSGTLDQLATVATWTKVLGHYKAWTK